MPLSTTARLVDPDSGAEIVSYGGWTPAGTLKSLDVGFPAVRESKTVRSGAHGSNDSTRWFGDRAITAEVWMPPQPNTEMAVDNLAACLNPSLRLWLYVQRPSWPSERRIRVRGATFTCAPGVSRLAQAGWIAPDGLFEDSVPQQVTLAPSGSGTGGLSMPVTMPATMTAGVVSGASAVDVGGTADAPLLIDMYGPCSDPALRCIDTGEQIKFVGLTIAAGDFLRVDTQARTAYLNGLTNQSRYNLLDFTTSTWLTLPAGQSVQVVYSPTSPGGTCSAVVTWNPRYV